MCDLRASRYQAGRKRAVYGNLDDMRVSCNECGCWIVADQRRCRSWLNEHPPGHPSWREVLEMQQRQIWGSDLARVLKKADDKRLRKLERAKKFRAKNRR